MKINNLTKHSVYRYMQRIRKDMNYLTQTEEQVSNSWKKCPEEFEALKLEITNEIDEDKLDYLGEFKFENHNTCEFFLDEKNRIAYLVNNKNLITCYHLTFVSNEKNNKAMFKIFMDEINEQRKERNKLEEKLSSEKDSKRIQVEEIELKIKKLKLETEMLEKEKKNIEEQKLSDESKLNLLNEEIRVTIYKMLNLWK